ncbi:hypothetical protein ACHAXT_000460 [Thalassiosira profunda]
MKGEASDFVDLSKKYSWHKSPDASEILEILVQDEADGSEVTIKLTKTTEFSDVFKGYADKKGISDLSLIRLAFNGTPITGDQTPTSLGIKDNGRVVYSPLTNVRHEIEKLLATESNPGKYCTGSEIAGVPIPSVEVILRDVDGNEAGTKKLSFPVDDADIKAIKDNAERAGVGVGEKTVVNLDVRKTWQIKPHGLRVSNVEQALESALQAVARDFGIGADYQLQANLYKLLLYEEGCFFARHRDNERLDGMFGTLVLELPSEYQGAALSEKTYTFNGGFGKPKRKTRSTAPGLHFAAFYADCYHQVSDLTSGHRAALVYHLTATPKQGQHRSIFCHVQNKWTSGSLGEHLPAISPSPPQPAEEATAVRLAALMDKLASEGDGVYVDGKPKKLAVVLSHHYTPTSFAKAGFDALKGTDRAIAQVIRAAAFCSPDASSLARLAAKKVAQVGGEEYAAADADAASLQAHGLVSEEFKKTETNGPFFDAAIALATVWDSGECTPVIYERDADESASTFMTSGSLISITGKGSAPLDLGPRLGSDNAGYGWHPSLFSGQERQGPPFKFHGPANDWGEPLYNHMVGSVYGEQVCYMQQDKGNHSLPIYTHELLFASEGASAKFRKDAEQRKHVVVEDPQDVEFLGNGGCYMGRMYSRAVILLWPKAHRQDVQGQRKGGKQALLQKMGAGKNSG